MPSFYETLLLIKQAHAGQEDKAGMPYWRHPLRVALRLGPGASEEERVTALLHDVVEDTHVTLARLAELGYSEATVSAVDLLSRREGETYAAFVNRIASSGNRMAILIKLADIEDNLDPARISVIHPSLSERYERARGLLREALR